jgi:electron transfer flavoprotein alpha subunit
LSPFNFVALLDAAHYAVVGDVNEIIPRLINTIKEGKAIV